MRSFSIYSAGWRKAANELERVDSFNFSIPAIQHRFFSAVNFLILIHGLYRYWISHGHSRDHNNQNAKPANSNRMRMPFYTLHLLNG